MLKIVCEGERNVVNSFRYVSKGSSQDESETNRVIFLILHQNASRCFSLIILASSKLVGN